MAEKISFELIKDLDFKTNEAYKRVRTNISFSGEDIRVISVTSSVPNEGKSSVSFNLARSFAEDGRKTLYIDADIRKSVMIARYGVDKETLGLTHYLSGQVKQLEDVVYETDVPNMDVIFTGAQAPNPAELLGLEKFRKMVATLREQYDYVIIDCPPLGSVIDAVLISRATDGTILVIEADNLSYKFVQGIKRELEINNCKILGVILNKVEMGGKGYYGYYGGYYGYSDSYGYGEEETKGKKNKDKKHHSSSSAQSKKGRHTRTFDTGRTVSSTGRTTAPRTASGSAPRTASGTATPRTTSGVTAPRTTASSSTARPVRSSDTGTLASRRPLESEEDE